MTAHPCPSCACPTPRVIQVTVAQRRVIGELARDGASNAEIGRRLHVTEDTVKKQLRQAMRSASSPSRTSLVCQLLRGELVLHTTGRRAS